MKRATKAKKTRTTRKPRPKLRKVAKADARIGEIIARLKREYPDAKCALNHENPLQLLVATILSAQCTDVRVNIVTKGLFKKYRTAKDFANARPEEFEQEIRSTGFFRNKTRSILGMANALVDRHNGRVPDTMEELTPLPGVGRKTANVVLGNAFDKNEGVVVDTHVTRLSGLLALTKHTDPVKIEQDLMKLVPREEWTLFSHLLILHGRSVCIAGRPKHEECVVCELCPACPA
ncbi:MAG TPA: endonuclease III [Gemmatimonadales bacterium]|jgi:endonuclease-3